jgi:hypothetical protein
MISQIRFRAVMLVDADFRDEDLLAIAQDIEEGSDLGPGLANIRYLSNVVVTPLSPLGTHPLVLLQATGTWHGGGRAGTKDLRDIPDAEEVAHREFKKAVALGIGEIDRGEALFVAEEWGND